MLSQMSEKQLDVKELIGGLREMTDKTITDALAANSGYDDDLIVAVVLAVHEMLGEDSEREVTADDLIWAGEFLDNLDTQGFRIKPKKTKKSR